MLVKDMPVGTRCLPRVPVLVGFLTSYLQLLQHRLLLELSSFNLQRNPESRCNRGRGIRTSLGAGATERSNGAHEDYEGHERSHRNADDHRHWERFCRRKCPFMAYDLGVRAKAVPRGAVVDGLEVSRHNVTHGLSGKMNRVSKKLRN
ncbi:hypothetical protein EYF80_006009 [Liparis tanakae]|uniref:Uncharacterized protein n=1 Tax=Liparis tanakae TaxID=230148 RepID=A0A4Z2J2W6_9TELE|nr:hypothetical protein EYF80_006009 [Liparis tanakae]